MYDLGLTDKVAVITGGSNGIGKATALALAREGAAVAVCARGEEALEEAAREVRAATEGRVLAVRADVSNADDVKSFIRKVADTYGGIDILVNNAGTAAGNAFENVTDEAWQADLDLKLFGAIRTSRLVIPYMKARGGGRIINITMIGGKQPGPRSAPSSVSRAAGIALTKEMSKDLARDNILVNTVCIGVVKSGQQDRNAMSSYSGVALDEAYRQMGGSIPLGRVGETAEAASVILFLASKMASYVTGTSINIDGGASGVV
ncbi:MAG: SDR family oxidoreductase [Dehalococcoidia bacterium]|nr:SDR family oxidoreductase [Dehalococcoidia bacterium]